MKNILDIVKILFLHFIIFMILIEHVEGLEKVLVYVSIYLVLLITLVFLYSCKINEELSKKISKLEEACGCEYNTEIKISLEKRVEFLEKHSQAFIERKKKLDLREKLFDEYLSRRKNGEKIKFSNMINELEKIENGKVQ